MSKRILFILHVPPPVHGAAMVGKAVMESRLVNSSFECRFINLSTSATVGEVGRFNLGKFKAFRRLRREVMAVLKEFWPDLVYMTPASSGPGFLKDFMIRRMLRRKGLPVVAHYHNKGVSTNTGRMWKMLYRRFFKGLKVILLSKRLYPDIAAYVREEDVLVCPNGIVVPAPAPTQLPSGDPHVLFLSNLIPTKGVFEILDACKILKDSGKRFLLDIAGAETEEIPASRLIDEIRSRDLEEQVVYHGRIYGGDKDSLFASADVFVLPTYYPNECFPLVVLEAMAHSLPVVSTPEGAIEDMVLEGKTGLIVERRDPVSLAGAIGKLLDDPSAGRSMGEAGRRLMLENFTMEIFEKQFVRCIERCL